MEVESLKIEINRELLHSFGWISPTFKHGRWCAIDKFLWTYGLLLDIDESGYRSRYCYHTFTEAHNALEKWDGVEEPTGWHRALVEGQPIRKIDENGDVYETS